MGDSSDNLPGVKGLGPKKLYKLFPEITGDRKVTLKEIIAKSLLWGQWPVSIIYYPYSIRVSNIKDLKDLIGGPNLGGREWLLSVVNKYCYLFSLPKHRPPSMHAGVCAPAGAAAHPGRVTGPAV
jgi:hypothetical protein